MDSFKSGKRCHKLSVVVRNHAAKHVTFRCVHVTNSDVEFCKRGQ